MSVNLRSLAVNKSTKISEIIEIFSQGDTDLLLVDENSIVSKPHLELLTDYPRGTTTALVAPMFKGDTRVTGDRIAGASSKFHTIERGNNNFVGILRLSQNQREAIIETLEKVKNSEAYGEAIDLVLVALVRAAIVVTPASLTGAPYIRSADEVAKVKVQEEINGLNIARLRLKMANRANDGMFSVFVLRKFSKLFTWAAVRLKMTPNQVTLISFAVGLLSAYEFSRGTFWTIFAGAILLQLSIIIDCADGELARYTRKFSGLGAWLDAITDRIKEYLVFFALAYGADKNGRDLWIPAMFMMVFQTFRHLSDYNFARINKVRSTNLPVIDFNQASDGYIPVDKVKKSRLEYWSKKAIQFPIGERWLVISASSIIGGAGFTFTIMPILALISIVLIFRSRVRKSRTWPKERVNKNLIDDQLDFFKNENSTNRFDWLEPSILRALEGAFFIWAVSVTDLNRPAAFLLLFAIIYSHYDALYRALQSERKPKWLAISGGFILGRIALLGIFLALGWSIVPLVWYFCVLFFVISSIQWVVGHKARGN
ncbi:CDP-alcohol phosphatidyltransferase [Candidatus Nanopelagicaceae bacterium]